jgi:predicted nucleotidyltransferase
MDISRLFKSKARTAIFQLYFANTESSYYLRELERIFDVPVSILRKELMRLRAEGVFLSEKKGNLLYYRLNTSFPLFEELKSIVRKTIGVEGLLRDAVTAIDGVDTAFMYGSFAKGKEKALSDVDLCIVGHIDEDQLIDKINTIEKSINREINYILYSPEELEKRISDKDGFILDLIDGIKIMLKGKEDDLR